MKLQQVEWIVWLVPYYDFIWVYYLIMHRSIESFSGLYIVDLNATHNTIGDECNFALGPVKIGNELNKLIDR